MSELFAALRQGQVPESAVGSERPVDAGPVKALVDQLRGLRNPLPHIACVINATDHIIKVSNLR